MMSTRRAGLERGRGKEGGDDEVRARRAGLERGEGERGGGEVR